MSGFEITFGHITYKCSSTITNLTIQNWHISAKIHDLSITITIPIKSQVSRSKCILFVERFHEALMIATKEQEKNLQFPTQMT